MNAPRFCLFYVCLKWGIVTLWKDRKLLFDNSATYIITNSTISTESQILRNAVRDAIMSEEKHMDVTLTIKICKMGCY